MKSGSCACRINNLTHWSITQASLLWILFAKNICLIQSHKSFFLMLFLWRWHSVGSTFIDQKLLLIFVCGVRCASYFVFSHLSELLLWIFVKSQLIAHVIVSVLILEFGSLIYFPVLTTILCGLGLAVLYASRVILCGLVLQSYMP